MKIDALLRIRYFALALLFLTLLAGLARGETGPALPLEDVAAGSDLFALTPGVALRETPTARSRILFRLPVGTRLAFLGSSGRFLRVELAERAALLDLFVTGARKEGRASGFVEADSVAAFGPDCEGTDRLLLVGRTLARDSRQRTAAAALLERGLSRRKQEGGADPSSEIALAETLESQAQAEPARARAVAALFSAAFEAAGPEAGEVRERAAAGMTRSEFPKTGSTLVALLQETDAWLELGGSARSPAVVRAAADRAGRSALAVGRLLLAAGRLDELKRLGERISAARVRLEAVDPGSAEGRALAGRGAILESMRGDGRRAFPREARLRVGDRLVVVRIDGELGNLSLAVAERRGNERETVRRSQAIPVLPVPGSLRVSSDGRRAAWLEVAGPAAIVPVMAALDEPGPAREVAWLAAGRPLRDRSRAHTLASLEGFSSDGRRMGFAVKAWDESAPSASRLAVVSTADVSLLFDHPDTARNRRKFRRLLH